MQGSFSHKTFRNYLILKNISVIVLITNKSFMKQTMQTNNANKQCKQTMQTNNAGDFKYAFLQ